MWFGVNLIPDPPGRAGPPGSADSRRTAASIRVGDPVRILEQADRSDGPLR